MPKALFRHRAAFLCLIALLFLPGLLGASPVLAGGPPPKEQDQPTITDEHVPNQVLVRFSSSASQARRNGLLKKDKLTPIREIKRLGVQVLELPPDMTVEDALAMLAADPDVDYAEPNYVFHTLEVTDPGLANQWSPNKIEAQAAWDITTGDPNIIIAVVDTGVDYGHSELAPNFGGIPGEVPGNGIDDDGNGYADDVYGWDFVNNDADPMDDHFHGTHVAGIAAAAANSNPDGLVGVCPNCALLAVKVLDSRGSGTLDAVANGIIYAADNGARVINLSLAGTSNSPTLDNAVSYAWNQGVVIVAGAGNSGRDQRFYPAAHPNAMAVAATNSDDLRSCFSSYGENYVSVAAPGELIYATLPRDAQGNDTYGIYSGTSMATPHVAGLAGLILSQNPGRTNAQVRALIESTAEDLGPVGTDAFFGAGRINARRALQSDTSPTTPATGHFADTLLATGYPNARKLYRDSSGLLHWVWHKTAGGYGVLYATSTDGVTWSTGAAIFASAAETGAPALASDGTNLYVAFASREGSSNARIWFAAKPLSGGNWSAPTPVMGGTFSAVRPALYLDPSNGRLHLAAGGESEDGHIYYASSNNGGANWSQPQLVQVATGAAQTARYAALHANSDRVYVVARTTEPTFYGLMAIFRTIWVRSDDGGSSWSAPVELASDSDSAGDEPGLSLAGIGDRLYLAYGQDASVFFRRSDDGAAWSDPFEVGAGMWPSITQADDRQGWVAWEDAGNLWLRRYTGDGWDTADQLLVANGLSKVYFPNLKLGASGNRIEWVTTHCSGAPFTLNYASMSLDEMPENYPVYFGAADYSVDEGAGTATVQVAMSEPSVRTVTVDYVTSDGTALNGEDYTAASGTLTFAPGETVKDIAITIREDTKDEPAQSFTVSLQNTIHAILGSPAQTTVTIVDNDGPPEVSFSLSNIYVNESAGLATVGVRLSAVSDLPVTVDYATSNGTAAAGADYQGTSGTVTVQPGEMTTAFTVAILDDSSSEADETIALGLANPVNAGLGNASALITIDDNDTLDFSVSLYTVNENAGQATITAKLSAASAQQVRVDYATGGGTATPGEDYTPASGTLTFAPGETSQSFQISIVDDTMAEDDETVDLTLSNPVNAELGSPWQAALKIGDNDTLKFSLSAYTVKENAGEATITVRMDAASDLEVRVDYGVGGGTATPGADYVGSGGTLVFAPGETSKSFAITVLDDIISEERETVNLTLSNPVNAGLAWPFESVLNIDDNDTLDFSVSLYSVQENAGQAVATVKLSAASDAQVSVEYVVSDGSAVAGQDYVPVGGTLVFSPGETSKSFAVPILDDIQSEPDETVNLTLQNPVNAELGSPSQALINIKDNDTLKFVMSSYYVKESDGQEVVDVRLSAASDLEVRVDYSVLDESALAGEDYLPVNARWSSRRAPPPRALPCRSWTISSPRSGKPPG